MNELTWVPLVTLIVLGACCVLAPSLTPRAYYFGLTVAPEFRDSEIGRGIRHGYVTAIKVATVAAVAFMVAMPKTAPVVSMLVVPLTACVAFFHARSRVKSYSTLAAPVREAEMSRNPERLPAWTLLALPSLAIPACVALYLHAHWAQIPDRFPVHWGWDGQPNGWRLRTPREVYGPLWFSVAIMAMLIIVGLTGYYGSRRSAMRVAMLKMMTPALYLIAFIFGMAALLPLHRFSTLTFMAPAVLGALAVLAYAYKVSSDPDIPTDATPDSCWRLSSFYYNPADPALFVTKRIGLGYTLNFGNRMSWLVAGMILALLAAGIFLLS